MTKQSAIIKALDYLIDNNIPLPNDLRLQLDEKGLLNPYKRSAMKQAESIEEANATYHDAITSALIDYFESGTLSPSKKEMKQAAIDAFSDMYDIGWTEGGQELPVDEDALSWLEARLNQEMGFIDILFQEAKELRKEDDFDYFTWITTHADNYTRTLAEVYNQAKLRAMDDIMVTFDGDDGEESCRSCEGLKGKRHKISWFVKRNYVPPFGIGLDCGRGGHCQHRLYDDEGNEVTI